MSLFNSFVIDNSVATDDINEATHWVAKYDSESCVKDHVIPGKEYELIKHDNGCDGEDYFIKSEDGYLTVYYLCHKGNFIRK